MPDLSIRPMRESDFDAARDVFRIAFGTFMGLPDPANFSSDREFISTRWKADPSAVLVAEQDGRLVGSNFATCWGSFGFFGPLTVKPELWNQGVAQRLLAPTMEMFDSWGVRAAGLYTFSNSPKHLALYQKFGFWPRFLTAFLSKPAAASRTLPDGRGSESERGRELGRGAEVGRDAERGAEPGFDTESGRGAESGRGTESGVAFAKYSQVPHAQRASVLAACREVTGAIFEGLDLSREISAVADQALGETVLIWGGDTLEAFAVCHCGAGSEAGLKNCYLKFAAARPGVRAPKSFGHLLEACQSLALERGLELVQGGVNLARGPAYRSMLEAGFRVINLGLAMQKPDAPGYNRPDVYAIDDWR